MTAKTHDRGDDFSSLQRRAFGEVETVDRVCPLCDEPNEGTPPSRYSLGVWTVKTCRSCRFTYIDKAPHYQALFRTMAWDRTSRVETEWRNSTRRVQQTFSRRTRWRLHLFPRRKMPDLLLRFAAPGNVIDLGCGDGAQLDGLDDRFVPHGVEIAEEAAARANERFVRRDGFAINAPCIEGLREAPDGFFSAATLRSYLEHELHPAAVLRELYRTLANGGIAIVKVPNFASLNRRVLGSRWCGFRHPDHLNYFTPRTLGLMAGRCGFRAWAPVAWTLPTSDNMYAILRKP